MIPLTEEQQRAVDYDGTLGLTSCPGSGKTRVIIAKLQKCIEEIRDTPRKVACITFTNTGVNEIAARLRAFGDGDDQYHCEISTIHSFCLNYVLRPYAHLVPHLTGEWAVISNDDEWYTANVNQLALKYGINRKFLDRFDGLQRRFPGTLPIVEGLPPKAVAEFFQRADADGKVTLGDIVYFSAKLVVDHEFIASALASRFAWFIVDEFQDTTIAQAVMLLVIYRRGRSKIFFVGDPNQSILGFAGAAQDLMSKFSGEVRAKTDYHLTGNFRSSALIVKHAELLCASNPRMEAVGAHKEFPVPPQYVHCDTAIEGLFDHFLPALDAAGIPLGSAAVLAPWWSDLLGVGRELRRRGVPILGPGARPYKRSHEFSYLSEAISAYLAAPDVDTTAAIQKALFTTLSNITEVRASDVYRYDGRRVAFRLVLAAKHILRRCEGVREWLLLSAAACETILIEEELLPAVHRNVFTGSAAAMLASMESNKIDVDNMAATELGMIALPKNCLSLMTMHQSKGREFDAVAVIRVLEGRVPHFETDHIPSRVDESRRLLYVAATRARKVLMYFTDNSHSRNTPSRFLKSPFLDMC